MVNTRKSLGRAGEAAARRFLEAAGWQIAAERWRCVYGEIDLVASRGDEWIFVEVKTRAQGMDAALAAVSVAKRERLTKAAYLCAEAFTTDTWRIDLIGVTLKNGIPECIHVEDVLGW